VYLTLKTPGTAPGDATAAQMDAIADLADRYNFGEVRVLHTQNLFFSDVAQSDLFTLWQALVPLNVATPNAETTADMICCPGLDYCSLANASSIPVARTILDTVDELDYLHDIGELRLNISGCINACGHHHTGHIGILGIDKKGDEWYQLSLGGSESDDAAIGQIIGPAFNRLTITPAIKAVLDTYIAQRKDDERFIDTYRRVGAAPFKAGAYAAAEQVEQGFDI
jgi:sulfite reductase (NADPH) hemoprotein beta-component